MKYTKTYECVKLNKRRLSVSNTAVRPYYMTYLVARSLGHFALNQPHQVSSRQLRPL